MKKMLKNIPVFGFGLAHGMLSSYEDIITSKVFIVSLFIFVLGYVFRAISSSNECKWISRLPMFGYLPNFMQFIIIYYSICSGIIVSLNTTVAYFLIAVASFASGYFTMYFREEE